MGSSQSYEGVNGDQVCYFFISLIKFNNLTP
jgi:hypothetical protein